MVMSYERDLYMILFEIQNIRTKILKQAIQKWHHRNQKNTLAYTVTSVLSSCRTHAVWPVDVWICELRAIPSIVTSDVPPAPAAWP